MMNNLNLIILGIIIVVIICIGIYLYKNNQVNKEPFYQTSGAVNPITIADMATSVMANNSPAPHEYAVFKMLGNLNAMTAGVETPLYKSSSYATKFPYSTKGVTTTSIILDGNTGKIMLDAKKKYRIFLTFNRIHVDNISANSEMDLLINSLDSSGTRIPAQSISNTSYVANNNETTVTLNLYTIIYDVSSIQPIVRYRFATAPINNRVVDTSIYMLIETCN